MKNKNKMFGIITLVMLIGFTLAACDNTSGRTQTADPYPTKRIENVTREIYNLSWIKLEGPVYKEHLLGIYGNDDEIPAKLEDDYLSRLYVPIGNFSVSDEATAIHDIYDAVLYEYTNWYQPNGPLTVTLTNITANSVFNMIETTLGFNAAFKGIGVSGSIKKESGTTVTKVQGTYTTQTWDLTQYDQSKLYKVVLVGKLTGIRHNVSLFSNDSNISSDTFYSAIVDQSSLVVKLVHN